MSSEVAMYPAVEQDSLNHGLKRPHEATVEEEEELQIRKRLKSTSSIGSNHLSEAESVAEVKGEQIQGTEQAPSSDQEKNVSAARPTNLESVPETAEDQMEYEASQDVSPIENVVQESTAVSVPVTANSALAPVENASESSIAMPSTAPASGESPTTLAPTQESSSVSSKTESVVAQKGTSKFTEVKAAAPLVSSTATTKDSDRESTSNATVTPAALAKSEKIEKPAKVKKEKDNSNVASTKGANGAGSLSKQLKSLTDPW
eukprot:Colp12_sorted_trinity150504_noHs@5741